MHELNDFRKGLRVMVEGNPYSVVDFQHVKPGKGNQFTRCKLRNLLTGQLLERTFKSGERFEVPNVEFRDVTFLFKDDNGYTFMDKTSYEQLTLGEAEVGENKNYLMENLESQMMIYNDRPVGIQVPNAVNLRIVQTDPGFKGNTVTNTFKAATLETGYVIQVPLHMKEGDLIRIDTRTGEYVERVNS
jgi:elongation factor P